MDSNIRPLEPADVEAVVAMQDRLATWIAPWRDPEAVRAAVHGWVADSTAESFDGSALVAVVDDVVVGFISVSTMRHFSGETDSYIGELIVDEAHEGRGIGRALVAAAERIAIDRGHRCITLTTGAANERGREFYDRLGFRLEDINFTKVLADQT